MGEGGKEEGYVTWISFCVAYGLPYLGRWAPLLLLQLYYLLPLITSPAPPKPTTASTTKAMVSEGALLAGEGQDTVCAAFFMIFWTRRRGVDLQGDTRRCFLLFFSFFHLPYPFPTAQVAFNDLMDQLVQFLGVGSVACARICMVCESVIKEGKKSSAVLAAPHEDHAS